MEKTKITEKDCGYAEDLFALLKQSIGEEEHHIGNFIETKSEKDLNKLNEARKRRTNLMLSGLEAMNVKLENQEWCILKHICATAMHIHELISRCSMTGWNEIAKRLSEVYKSLYLSYLDILGVNEKNISNKSQA